MASPDSARTMQPCLWIPGRKRPHHARNPSIAKMSVRCLRSDACRPMLGTAQGHRGPAGRPPLTLMDVARSWPGAERIRAPLKALDRLLSNRHLQAERSSLHAAMAVWLLRQPQPAIVVDWCDLKADRSQHLLRAAVAVGGRTPTLLDAVFPDGMQGSPVAEKQFLRQLAALIPAGCTPILVTDAGSAPPGSVRSKRWVGTSWDGCGTAR